MVTFVVIVKDAQDLADIQLFGTQDPYVEITTSSDKKRTATHDNGGTNPSSSSRSDLALGWDEELRISAPDMFGMMKFTM